MSTTGSTDLGSDMKLMVMGQFYKWLYNIRAWQFIFDPRWYKSGCCMDIVILNRFHSNNSNTKNCCQALLMLRMLENTNHFIPKHVIVINLVVCEELGTSCYVRKNTTSNKDHMCHAKKKKLCNVLAMFSIMKNNLTYKPH